MTNAQVARRGDRLAFSRPRAPSRGKQGHRVGQERGEPEGVCRWARIWMLRLDTDEAAMPLQEFQGDGSGKWEGKPGVSKRCGGTSCNTNLQHLVSSCVGSEVQTRAAGAAKSACISIVCFATQSTFVRGRWMSDPSYRRSIVVHGKW